MKLARDFILLQRTPAPVPVPSGQYNPEQIRGWISECNSDHQRTCHAARTHIRNQYLIDCHKLVVMAAKEGYEYVALSYVWGASRDAKVTYHLCSSKDDETLLPKTLPPVIVDAITVTLSLGIQYLWVDRYCVAQDNPELKHDQIATMDAIYANSYLTIIAAAGDDANHGLPGVNGRPRTAVPVANIGTVQVLWFQEPCASIRKSKWNTRGWTYQEAVLARRRLVFLDDQMYFECEYGHDCEMLTSGTIPRNSGTKLWGNEIGHTFPGYMTSTLRDYTARELGHDNDSLLAFIGILNHLQTSQLDLQHIWGIHYYKATRYPRVKEDLFAVELSWTHSQICWESLERPRRRPMHPSWTWAGWAGEVNRKSCFLSNATFRIKAVLRRVSLEHEGDHGSELTALADCSQNQMLNYRILVIETWAISPDKIYIEEKPNGIKWKIHDREVNAVSLSEGADSEASLARELKENWKQWRCVMLGSRSLRYQVKDILLVLRKEDEESWVRVGVLHLRPKRNEIIKLEDECTYLAEFRIR
ncbi:hypothetical protein M426DRAFT_259757 [Hypoxylon sp. CI-4A]|nr:hypothetical protein M426DRAFT_259757 [Hypoxylon sp. CI-4A]